MNLPILKQLKGCQRILLAGMGGGFDVFGSLPIMFELQEQKKDVFLASLNTSGCNRVTVFTKGRTESEIYPETHLYRHLNDESLTMFVLPKHGIKTITNYYKLILDQHKIDAVILVDGGVDSLMRGNEEGAGTLLEDTLSLASAIRASDETGVKQRILACIGFGTELEERLDHYRALENMSHIVAEGGFYGACALTTSEGFDRYVAACEAVWEHGRKSHIHTRVISSVYGLFGEQNAYDDVDARVLGVSEEKNFINPLMSLYWFFNMDVVAERNLLIDPLKDAVTSTDNLMIYRQILPKLMANRKERKSLPY